MCSYFFIKMSRDAWAPVVWALEVPGMARLWAALNLQDQALSPKLIGWAVQEAGPQDSEHCCPYFIRKNRVLYFKLEELDLLKKISADRSGYE